MLTDKMGALRRQPAMLDLHAASLAVSVEWDDRDKDPWGQEEINHGSLKRRSTTLLGEIENRKRIKEVRQGDKYRKASPMAKRSEPLLRRPVRPSNSPDTTTTIVLDPRRRSFSSARFEKTVTYDHAPAISPCSEYGEGISLVLGMSKPPQRFHASEYPESAYATERPDFNVIGHPASQPMVREYTSLGWDGENIENRFDTGKALERLPLINASRSERTKKGNSKSPWHQVSRKRSGTSPSSNSTRDHDTRTHTLLHTLEGGKSKSYQGGLSLNSTSTSLSPSPTLPSPTSSSHSGQSFLSASMSYHSIRILTVTTAQTRPHMTSLANASDVSILAPSTIGIGYSSSVGTGSPGSLPESLEAECIDLTETGGRASQANGSKRGKRHSWMSHTSMVDLEAVEIIAEELPSTQPSKFDPVYLKPYYIPPVHAQTPIHTHSSAQRSKLKRAHTYANLKDVWKLASFPGGLIEVQPDEETVKQENRGVSSQVLEPLAVIRPPSLGPPIDILSRPASSTISRNITTAQGPPTSHSRSSFRPVSMVSMCSPPDTVEAFNSPQTSNIRKIKQSPFQATRNSLKGMLNKSFKGRSLAHVFDNAEQDSQQSESSLKSKISGPLLIRNVGGNMDKKKSDKEWREEVLKDVVGRTLSSQFKLLEKEAKQQRESWFVKEKTNQKTPSFGIGLKNRSPIPETLLSAVSTGERKNPITVDSYEERMKMKSGARPRMKSSLSLRIVTDEAFNPETAGLTPGRLDDPIGRTNFRNHIPPRRLSGKGRPTSAPLLSAWSSPRPKCDKALSQLTNPPIAINHATPRPEESPKTKPRHPPSSPSPSPKDGRGKSGRIFRRPSIMNLLRPKDSKHQNTSQSPPRPKKMASGTFTLTSSIRSSFLAIIKHNIQTARQEDKGKSPRTPCITPPSTLPVRTPIHQRPELYRPLPRARSSFELTLNLEPAKPLLDELLARDDALGFLEGRNKREQRVEVDIEKVLEWRKEVEEDI
ncbi:hypothetical protein C366_05222 [Cryptococcus neoformans Tu401-1]|nr:hypothetical protein C366_05222 [Cryptococcus neoformans var. grubii Tu401-1]